MHIQICTIMWQSNLVAGNLSIVCSESLLTDSTPGIVDAELQTPREYVASHQSNLSITALTSHSAPLCREGRD